MTINDRYTVAPLPNGRLPDSRTGPKHSGGFSLVELLIASATSMVVFAAVFTFIGAIFDSSRTLDDVSETQQKVRVALNEIARELTRSGTGLPTGGISIPAGTGSTAIIRPGLGDNLPTANGVIAIVTPGDGAGPTIADVDTDAVTIITIDQTSPTWSVSAIDTSTAPFQVDCSDDIHAGDTQLFVDDMLLFTNFNGSLLNVVSTVDAVNDFVNFADDDPIDINQPGAQFGNLISLENPGQPGVYPPTTATRAWIITYYLDNTDPNRPRLMRQRNGQSAIIAEDVYNLQVQYDLFDFNTSTATAGLDTTAIPNQIRAVALSLNGRSSQVDLRTGDYYHFGLLTKVNVRNTTFQNRYTNN